MGRGNGGSILDHIGANNADKEGTTAIVEKCRNLLKNTNQARVGQIILYVPVSGSKCKGYSDSRRMAINRMVQQLCIVDEVGFVDSWEALWRKKKFAREIACILVGKGRPFFADGPSWPVASGLDNLN